MERIYYIHQTSQRVTQAERLTMRKSRDQGVFGYGCGIDGATEAVINATRKIGDEIHVFRGNENTAFISHRVTKYDGKTGESVSTVILPYKAPATVPEKVTAPPAGSNKEDKMGYAIATYQGTGKKHYMAGCSFEQDGPHGHWEPEIDKSDIYPDFKTAAKVAKKVQELYSGHYIYLQFHPVTAPASSRAIIRAVNTYQHRTETRQGL